MEIEFRRLTEVDRTAIIELMNNPLVRRQMPLLRNDFGERECEAFVAAKERVWAEHGYGPWAFVIDGQFAGWGGLQPEHGEADLALVLHPDHWGRGRALYHAIIGRAFGEMGLDAITVLLPPSRTRIKGILRLGFVADGELLVGGERFHRFRLTQTANRV